MTDQQAPGATIKSAQRAIDKAAIPLELVRGDGYHYFVYDKVGRGLHETVSVYTCYTNTHTAAEWAAIAKEVFGGIKARLS